MKTPVINATFNAIWLNQRRINSSQAGLPWPPSWPTQRV